MSKRVRHVDIISNDPLAGRRRLLAKVQLNGKPELELFLGRDTRANEASMWTYLRSQVELDPMTDPNGFLEALPQSIDATYVVASDVHDEAHCPFRGTPTNPAQGAGHVGAA
jgi:hypothetical protein